MTAMVRKLSRLPVVVEAWLSALRRQPRRHHMRESGLLAGLPGVRRVASGSGLLADTAPWCRSRHVQHRRVAQLSRRLEAPLFGPGRGPAVALACSPNCRDNRRPYLPSSRPPGPAVRLLGPTIVADPAGIQ
jgi:hypothetical protein